jgi:hypothetical protein
MSDPGMKGTLDAKFRFLPRGNQQLIILAGLTALIGSVATIVFAYVGKPIMVPACVAGAATVLAVSGWLLCRGSTEFEGSPPVTFTETRTGRSLTADPRLLSNPKRLRLLGDLITAILDRHPLPTPDGMVRPDGTPDVTRIAEAEAVVNGINDHLQQETNRMIDSLAATVSSPAVAQPAILTLPGSVAAGANVASSGPAGAVPP